MAGDIKLKYAASSALTVTNLQTLASSATLIAGWFSASVNNTSNVYADVLYGGTFTTGSSNRQGGTIAIYAAAALNDTPTWPATSSGTLGTEGAGGFVTTYARDALCRLIAAITVDSTNSAIFTFPPTGIAQFFGGALPPYHGLFVTTNAATSTNAGFASAAIYSTPVLAQYT